MANPLTKVILNNIVGKSEIRKANCVMERRNLTLKEENLLIEAINQDNKKEVSDNRPKNNLSKITLKELSNGNQNLEGVHKQTKGISLEELAAKMSKDTNNG